MLTTRRRIGLTKEKRLRELWYAAGNSAGCLVHDEVIWESQSMVHELKAIQMIVAECEQRIEKVAQQFPECEFLLSIHGFGPIVSAMVLGAIGDPWKFNHQ